VYSGGAKHLTKDMEWGILSGDFVNIKPGQVHGYKNIRNLVLMNILIKPSFFSDDRHSLGSIPAFQTLFGQEPEEEACKNPIIHFKLDHRVFSLVKKMIEITLDLGFNDSNYFSRLLRKNLGLSTREYRNKYLMENLLEKAE
jgi:AraC family L-rhamnose operon transcriptional activator RhaR/AraC family L-rhamnose operon regulatory protein RhaS